MITESTAKKISNLRNLGHLSKIILLYIPEIFNVEDFSIFIKNRINTKFMLEFDNNISEQYKNQLNDLIDTLIESRFLGRYIEYYGQDREKENIMSNRYFD
uniref:Uncharacterized protein n=1 Tax=Panagrolaimus superbus TaxID=310955 RepID=A0A914Y5S4_9BILA